MKIRIFLKYIGIFLGIIFASRPFLVYGYDVPKLELSSVLREREFLEAVWRGDVKKIDQLLDEGANISARDGFLRTPLHIAAYYGHKEVLKILLERGAPVDAVTSEGNTSLHYAAMKGHPECAIALMEYNAQNQTNKNGLFPFDYACYFNRDEMISLLEGRGNSHLHECRLSKNS